MSEAGIRGERSRTERRAELQQAFAFVHGIGRKMSEAALIEHMLEHGIVLPSREEREKEIARRQAEAESGDTAELSAPSSS